MVKQSLNTLPTGNFALSFYWTANSNGSVDVTLASQMPEIAQGMRIFQVETVPGSPAPTNNYSVALKNSFGTDLMAGAMVAVSSTLNQLWPATSATPPFVGLFSLVITGNLVANAQGVVVVYFGPSTLINSNAGSPGPAGPTGPTGPSGSPGGGLSVSNFQFSQTPGGTLSSGISANVTLAPVPQGINGTDSGHYLYVSGGTGTAEAVLITGGTAVSGASSGTVIFTPANSHSGAWTISSATGGAAEAQQFVLSSANKKSIIQFDVPVTFYAGVFGSTSGVIDWHGIGSANLITRNPGYTGDLFHVSTTTWTFNSLQTFSAAVPSAGSFINSSSGVVVVHDCQVTNEFQGIKLGGQATIISFGYLQTDYTNQPTSAIEIDFGGNILLSGINVQSSNHTHANLLTACINVNGTDTLTITNCQLTAGGTGIVFNATTNYVANVTVSNTVIIDILGDGISFNNPSNITADVEISNVVIQGDSDGTLSTTGQGVGIKLGFGSGNSINSAGITIVGCNITGFYFEGIWIQANNDVVISGCQIYNNNVSNTVNESGVKISEQAITNLLFSNNIVSGNKQSGFRIELNGNSGNIVNNIFYNNPSAFSGLSSSTWTGTVASNFGYNPVGQTTISVGSSPFTYTNGPSPSVVYIHGGTVSSIVIGSSTLAVASPAQVTLAPGEAVVVTYSVLPTMIADVL